MSIMSVNRLFLKDPRKCVLQEAVTTLEAVKKAYDFIQLMLMKYTDIAYSKSS